MVRYCGRRRGVAVCDLGTDRTILCASLADGRYWATQPAGAYERRVLLADRHRRHRVAHRWTDRAVTPSSDRAENVARVATYAYRRRRNAVHNAASRRFA